MFRPSDLLNPDKLFTEADANTFLLTLVGMAPGGEILKDQIQAYQARREQERLEAALATIRRQLAGVQLATSGPRLTDLVLDILHRIERESAAQKRAVYTHIICRVLQVDYDLDRVSWLLRTFDQLSLDAVRVLGVMAAERPHRRQQFHSHAGILTRLAATSGYPMLLAIVRELERVGLVTLDLDSSSVVDGNARFILWWTDLATELDALIRTEQAVSPPP